MNLFKRKCKTIKYLIKFPHNKVYKIKFFKIQISNMIKNKMRMIRYYSKENKKIFKIIIKYPFLKINNYKI
jgi:hypothetical protein